MLRITPEPEGPNGQTLRLEGQLTGPWVDELASACQRAIDETGASSLVVDMTGVRFVDSDGTRLLRALVARRVTLVNCSNFVSEQLKEASDGHS